MKVLNLIFVLIVVILLTLHLKLIGECEEETQNYTSLVKSLKVEDREED